MSASWPAFWEHIPEADRSALREVIAQLLKTGVVLGNSGHDLQLFRLAQDYQREIAEYLSVLSLELFLDPSEPIFQARPIPGECALTAKFSKDVAVQASAGCIIIRCDDLIIAEHEEAAKPRSSVVLPEHAAALWKMSLQRENSPPPSWRMSFTQEVASRPLESYEVAA